MIQSWVQRHTKTFLIPILLPKLVCCDHACDEMFSDISRRYSAYVLQKKHIKENYSKYWCIVYIQYTRISFLFKVAMIYHSKYNIRSPSEKFESQSKLSKDHTSCTFHWDFNPSVFPCLGELVPSQVVFIAFQHETAQWQLPAKHYASSFKLLLFLNIENIVSQKRLKSNARCKKRRGQHSYQQTQWSVTCEQNLRAHLPREWEIRGDQGYAMNNA